LAARTYLDFDVAVTRRGDALDVRVLDSPAGETGSVASRWPAFAARWTPRGRGLEDRRLSPVAEPATLVAVDDAQVGADLFTALMPDSVLVRFRESGSRAAAARAGLRLMLRFEGGADALPWELLHDPETHTFLALDPGTPVVRCTETPTREPAAGTDERVRVLVAISSPVGTAPLDAERERQSIAARLEPLAPGGAVTVDVLEDASLDGIRAALEAAETHVFHYIGHGTLGTDGRTALALTDSRGQLSVRSVDEVADVLAAAPTLRLVVLNSCHGSPADPTDPFAGAGTTLVRAGIPAVVAMRTTITDDGAITFARGLYEGLAAAEPVESAVTRARATMAAADSGVADEWPIVALHLSSSLAPGLRVGPLPRLDEDVEFTVARPPRLRAERWETMLVLAHHGEVFVAADGRTVDQPAEVRQLVAGLFGSEPVTSTSQASSLALPRGAQLLVVPDLPDHVDCDPPVSQLSWSGEVAQVRFQLRAPSASVGSTVTGWLRVFCGPVVVAETGLTLEVVADTSQAALAPPPKPAPLTRYRRIFPCFAPEDAAVVEGVAAVAEALGDDYLDRVLEAERGDAPSAWLLPLIAEADVFQLFWSSHSMRSPACREQWEHAVATGKDGFVLPLYWEQPFPRAEGLPPASLETLRFVRLPSTLAASPVTQPTVPTGVAPPAPSPAAPPPPPAGTSQPWQSEPAPAPSTVSPPPTWDPQTSVPPAPTLPPDMWGPTLEDRTRGMPAARSGSAGRLGAASLASALLAAGFIAIGWSPGIVPGTRGSAFDVIGLTLLGVAVVLAGLAVAAWVRGRWR
jgi:hypothetical protein